MKTFEEYQKEYDDYCKDIDERDAIQKKNHEQYIKDLCPFHIGDEIQIFGYSYKGKKGIIRNIIPSFYYDYSPKGAKKLMSYKVCGVVINQNGKPGKNSFLFTESDYLRTLKKV
jgi:hypothetical protein